MAFELLETLTPATIIVPNFSIIASSRTTRLFNNDDDLSLLTGGDVSDSNTANAQIAAAIRQAENPTLVTQAVKSVLDTTEELEKEKKKKSFIFDQVMKAATALTNAVSNLDDSMSKEGIGKQIENIEGALVSLKDWIK